jgi:hypothetical protein
MGSAWDEQHVFVLQAFGWQQWCDGLLAAFEAANFHCLVFVADLVQKAAPNSSCQVLWQQGRPGLLCRAGCVQRWRQG